MDCVAKWPRNDDLLDPCRADSLQRSGIESSHVAQHRHDNVALAELEGELRGGDKASGTLSRRTQLRCALQRCDRDGDRAALPCASGRLLELMGDLFMRAADQCRAVPDSPVRVGLQDLGKRLVDAAQLRQTRALAHGRADQRVTEPDRMHVEGDDRGLFGGFDKIESQRPAGDGTSGLEDLTHTFSVVERRNLQEQASLLRQLGHACGERPLEPLRERQRAGRHLLHAACSER